MGKGGSSEAVPAVATAPPPLDTSSQGLHPTSAQHWAHHTKLQPDPATLSLRPQHTDPGGAASLQACGTGEGAGAGPEPTQTRPALDSGKLQTAAGKPCVGPVGDSGEDA